MRTILLSLLFAASAMPVFGQSLGRHDLVVGVPAPLIGAGLPLVVLVGGAWVCYRILKKHRR